AAASAAHDPWSQPTRAGGEQPRRPPPTVAASYATRDRPVHSFLARAPTRPNLPPLDVPELTDETLARLVQEANGGGAAGDQAVTEMEAELPTGVTPNLLQGRLPSSGPTDSWTSSDSMQTRIPTVAGNVRALPPQAGQNGGGDRRAPAPRVSGTTS